MQQVEGKTAFITGGGSGIGLGMAKAFSNAGLNVVVLDVRSDRLERAEQTIQQLGGNICTVEGDVRDVDSIKAAADQAVEAFGQVDILCSNAGVGVGGPFVNMTDDAWNRVVDINLWGVINCAKVFVPRMIESGGGHIVNTSSIMGLISGAGSGSYCTTKFAVVGFSECLRDDLAGSGTNIGVSVLCPFIVDTPIFYPDLADDDLEGIAARKKRLPMMKFALDPVHVGELVLKAIQDDELYVFCDGKETRNMVFSRFDRIRAALDRQFPV